VEDATNPNRREALAPLFADLERRDAFEHNIRTARPGGNR